jgi:hypothetical protein
MAVACEMEFELFRTVEEHLFEESELKCMLLFEVFEGDFRDFL